MNVGDPVKVIKNDMSLVIKTPGVKDNKFFDKIGTITNLVAEDFSGGLFKWYGVLFDSGFYVVREDAIEVINGNESW
tara:strand:+ start:313 stop:543 length:231 start_codon:yes stop_codon:yes gene_type:complete